MMDLKVARVKARLTGQEVARRIGVSPQTISRLENGWTRNINAETVAKLARLYGLPVGDLMEALFPDAGKVVAIG